MDATIDHLPARPGAPQGLGCLLASLAAMAALADFCFWRESPGLSVGLFALGATGIILLNRPRMRWTRGAACLTALIGCAAAESAIGFCFSNALTLLVLMLALAGETYYAPMSSGWSRWSEAAWTMMKTPLRWTSLLAAITTEARANGPRPASVVQKAARMAWIVVPGLAITAIFSIILGDGNALFAKFANDWTAAISNWILSLDLNFWRCSFWVFVAIIALPVLWPSPAPRAQRIWTKEMPLLPEFTSPQTARLQSAVTLGLLNALFCCVNTIDAVYLWAGQALPQGVNASAFVHQGVFSLIMAVLFSAVLLAGMFHQARTVSAWTPLRLLGLVWIGQNLVLLAGVFLRLKLYVDAFDLSVLRVNVAFFLVLVVAGFVLLAIHVWLQRTLGWLLHANMLATFLLFYTVQFADTAGFVARYNVKLWRDSHETRKLDLPYLESLGPPAFESIESVAQSRAPDISREAADYLKTARERARNQLEHTPFASWQLRDRRCQLKLLATTLE